MARRDRLKQGADAKERVMERLAGGGVNTAASASNRRIDRLKSPNIINEFKAGINQEVRNMAPEIFNPQQNLDAFDKLVQPKPKPAAPTSLPSVENQLRTSTTAFTQQSYDPNLRPMLGPPVPPEVGINQRQAMAQQSPLSRLGEFSADLAADIIPGNFGNKQVKRPIEMLSKIPDIPGVTTSNTATNFIRGAGDMATLGLSSYIDRMGGNVDAAEGATQTTAGRVGQIAGAVALPAGRIVKGASLLSNIGRGAAYGAGFGLGMEGGEVATGRNNQSLGQRALDVGFSTGLGGAGAGVFSVVGSLLGRLKKNNVADEVIQEVQERLALPAPKQRGNINQAETPSVVTDYTGPTNGLPAPAVSDPTRARVATQVNPFREQFETLMQRAKQMQDEGRFTPGREDADLESLWSQMAGREGVSLDELIQRAYPTKANKVTPDLVQQARRNQYSREVAGAPLPVKTRAERLINKQGVLGETEPVIERVGRSPQVSPKPKAELLPADTQQARPRTEVNESMIQSSPKPKRSVQEADDFVKEVNKPRTRDRVYSYLDNAEKAARERIAKRGNRLSSTPFDQYADYSIIMAAKLGKGTIKAADFTEELVKEFGEKIRPQADRIFRQTKEVLRTQERKASKEGMAADEFNNSGKGDAASFESKITRGRKAKKTSFDEKWERFKTRFTEDIAPINKLERNVTGKISSAEDSIYKSARLFKGAPEKINQFIDQRLKPIVRGVEKDGYHSDDLGRYALAVHAKDVNAAGYISGYTNAEIADVISKFGTPEMEAARKQLIKINRDLLDELVDSGVVSKQMRDALNERWQNYIPLFRDVEDVAGRNSGLSEALANVANPIKKLKGSEENVIEPLENMVTNIVKNISAVERNKVASHISRLSKLDTDQRFIRKLEEGEQVQGKSVVSVKENGDNVHYEVEKDVRDALLTLDKESSAALIRFLSIPASWLRAGATLTPEFMVRNPIRDYRNARIISESGFGMSDYAVGMASSIMGKFGKGKLYQEWVENLGAYGNIVSEDRGVFAAAQRKILTESSSKKFLNVINPKSFIGLLRNISDVTESATKVGEYRAALRKGASKEEAAYRSRDLMDFARAGTNIRQANKIVAFLNANIQGKSRTIRAFKKNPIRTSVRVFQHMAVPTVGIHYYNKYFANDEQKKTIKNAPDWQRNTFWLVAVPGTDMVARIPKPFDFAVVANVVDRSLDLFADNDKEAFEGFGKGVLADNALPMMITGLQPLIEGLADYSFFKQSSVIPKRDAGLAFEDQYDPIRTSETAKAIAKGVDSTLGSLGGNFRSPYIVDNTIQGLFAGGGKYVTDAADAILGKIGAVDRPVNPEKRTEQKPVSRSFLVDPLQGGRSTEKFYNELEDLERKKRSSDINDKEFASEKRLKKLNKTSDKMSDISKEIREIERSDASAKQKRAEIEPLMKERNALAEEAVKAGALR